MAFFGSEFGPFFAFCYSWVYVLFDDGGADLARCFDLFAGVVEMVGYDAFCAICVGDYLLWREDGGVVELFVVCPVGSSRWG